MEPCWVKYANGPHVDPLVRLTCIFILSLSLSEHMIKLPPTDGSRSPTTV